MAVMARELRIQYPGAIYLVMNRGDLREAIIHDPRDYERFLQTLAQACAKARWQLIPDLFTRDPAVPEP
jgi:putative transposase